MSDCPWLAKPSFGKMTQFAKNSWMIIHGEFCWSNLVIFIHFVFMKSPRWSYRKQGTPGADKISRHGRFHHDTNDTLMSIPQKDDENWMHISWISRLVLLVLPFRKTGNSWVVNQIRLYCMVMKPYYIMMVQSHFVLVKSSWFLMIRPEWILVNFAGLIQGGTPVR